MDVAAWYSEQARLRGGDAKRCDEADAIDRAHATHLGRRHGVVLGQEQLQLVHPP